MIILGVDVHLLPILIITAAYLVYRYGTRTFNTFKRIGVPYVTPIPFLGTFLYTIAKYGSLPKWDMEALKRFPGRFHGVFLGMKPALEVSDVDILKQVCIKEFPKFTNRWNINTSETSTTMANLLTLIRDDHWKHTRNILTPTFTSGKLKQMYRTVDNCAEKLVNHIRTASGSPIIVKDYASAFTMDVIASTAFGLDLDTQTSTDHPFVKHAGTFFGIPRHKTFYSRIKPVLAMFAMIIFPSWLQRLLKSWVNFSFFDYESVEYFEDFVDKVVAQAKSQTSMEKNFITSCAEIEVDLNTVPGDTVRVTDGIRWTTKGLTRPEIRANCMIFLVAGYETTATAIQFFLYNLALHPDIQEKLYKLCKDKEYDNEEIQKIEYLDWCISESLRVFPPVLRFDRECSEDVVINGIHFPKGIDVSFAVYAMHHDPEYWSDPEVFRPERFSPEHKTELQQLAWCPFGVGNRNCIGMRLALLEIKVASYKLINAFRFEKTAQTPLPDKLEFVTGSAFLQAREPLRVSAIPRL